MSPGDRQVLLAGVTDAVARRLVALLTPFNVSLQRIPWSNQHIRTATEREFDAIIIGFPVGGPHVDFVLEALRSPTSLSRHAGIILISRWDAFPDAQRLVGRGADLVVPQDSSYETWRDSVLSVVDVSRRFHIRTHLRLTAEVGGRPLSADCQTENVSMSGMLVRCSRAVEMPPGSTLQFAMAVPGEDTPIQGEARVTRATDPEREEIEGIGARFLSFSDTGRSRLRSVLAKHPS